MNPPRDTSIITATSRPPRDSRINDQSDTEGTRIHLRHGGCAPGSVSGHEGSHSRAPLMTNRHTRTHTHAHLIHLPASCLTPFPCRLRPRPINQNEDIPDSGSVLALQNKHPVWRLGSEGDSSQAGGEGGRVGRRWT